MKAKPPTSFGEAIKLLGLALDLRHAKPRSVGRGACQEVVHREADLAGGTREECPTLADLPILKCWPLDAGRFITLPGVVTRFAALPAICQKRPSAHSYSSANQQSEYGHFLLPSQKATEFAEMRPNSAAFLYLRGREWSFILAPGELTVVPRNNVRMKTRNPDQPTPSGRKPAKPRVAAAPKTPQKAAAAATERTTAPAAKAKRTTRSSALKVPPILLEGDAPAAPVAGGPGQRYALGPTPPSQHVPPAESELPEAYGTQQLFLTARDPHWLYAHWDLSREQLKKYNGLSVDGHLVLRIYRGALEAEPLSEIHVHPESRNWFVPVPDAGTKYLSALGYYDSARRWVALSCSGATLTPPDSLSDETTQRFATIPFDVSYEQLLAIIKTALREHVPLVEAIQQMRAQGHKILPAPEEIRKEWTPAQEKALAEIVSMDHVRRIWVGSLEITELVRRQLEREISSLGLGQFGIPSSWSGALASMSSPFGGVSRQRGFWFNVNAELIIYGATEPDATVTIGDRTIKLRPDGTFSFRFALPDGQYSLPAAAHSADGEETRKAHLQFSRSTEYTGEVGAHPQDKRLQPPLVSAVA